MRSIIGIFEHMHEVEQVVDELDRAGCARDRISVLAHQGRCAPSVGPVHTVSSTGSIGAAAAVGGLGGFTAGLVALAVPGIGPILAAGPIAAELLAGGIGTIAGGLISWLRQQDAPNAEGDCEAVRRGGILLTFEADEDEVEKIIPIIGEHRLIEMDAATLEWHRAGRTRSNAEPGMSASTAVVGLPFDPESVKHSTRKERADRRAVRPYVRVS
jgi:hypothetical protein